MVWGTNPLVALLITVIGLASAVTAGVARELNK